MSATVTWYTYIEDGEAADLLAEFASGTLWGKLMDASCQFLSLIHI